MSIDVVVPDLGDFDEVEVIEVFVKPGDTVAEEDPLITLETEKAAMDVPSTAAGKVAKVKVGVGDTVSAGEVIVVLEADGKQTKGDVSKGEADEQAGTRRDDNAGADDEAAPRGSADNTRSKTGEATSAHDGASEPASAEPQPVLVPEIGDFTDVEVIEVLVDTGDSVEVEQGLITLETEKATMDVPSTLAGEIVELKVKVGDTVNAGDEIVFVRPEAGASAADGQKSNKQRSAEPAKGAAPPPERDAEPDRAKTSPKRPSATKIAPQRSLGRIDEASFSKAHASPSVRKLARELGVDLGRVTGSGRKGRVTADDVKAFVKEIMQGGGVAAGPALPKVPDVDFARFGKVETQRISRIQKISGPRLHASWVNIPHVTQHDEADITELEEMRQSLKQKAAERDIKLTPLAFVIRAVVLTLNEFPVFKSSLGPDGESLVLKHYTHVGFAADTPNGLVVPVIRDADKKDIYELAAALGDLSQRARDGKLKADDMQGGVFTISSLGGIGGTFFTPIINAPEVAILGVSRNQWKPVYQDGGFVPRLTLPLSLSYDHRVIDGASAVRFTTRLAEVLGEVDRLVEAIP